MAADLTGPQAPAEVLERAEAAHGPVDVVVHNAAVETVGRLDALAPGDVEHTVGLNLTAPLVLTRLLLPGMLARRRGHVVALSSLAGVATFPGLAVYGATKAGLTHATAALALELRGSGVGTTTVELGPDASPMMDRARRDPASGGAFARAGPAAGAARPRPRGGGPRGRRSRGGRAPHRAAARRAAPLAALAAGPRALVRLALTGVPVDTATTGATSGVASGAAPGVEQARR